MEGMGGWVLLYGRRKVGKTFLVRNFIRPKLYVLVKRGGGAIFDGGPLKRTDDYGQVMDIVVDALGKGEPVAVDEFHRLPGDFLDHLQMVHPKGRLILLGSAMHVARDVMSRRSPLLGLLAEVKLSLLTPVEIFLALSRRMSAEKALELSPYLRDPWTLQYLEGSPERTISNILLHSRNAIPALTGEVFVEEDRQLTMVYEGILRSVSDGKSNLGEISGVLHSRKLIRSNDPANIRPYVKVMEDMDLMYRIPYFDRNKNHYALRSSIMELFYYLDEKYGSEAGSPRLIREVLRDRSPMHIQSFAGELMAQVLDGEFQYQASPDHDIDIIVTRRKKPVFVGEVKWTKKVSMRDVYRFLDNTEGFRCCKALITKTPLKTDEVEVITPGDLLKIIKNSVS